MSYFFPFEKKGSLNWIWKYELAYSTHFTSLFCIETWPCIYFYYYCITEEEFEILWFFFGNISILDIYQLNSDDALLFVDLLRPYWKFNSYACFFRRRRRHWWQCQWLAILPVGSQKKFTGNKNGNSKRFKIDGMENIWQYNIWISIEKCAIWLSSRRQREKEKNRSLVN